MIAILLHLLATINVTSYGAVGDAVTNSFGATGTDNTPFIASAIAAAGTNDTIYFPPGRYLLIPPFMATNGVMASAYEIHAAITLSRGGLTFLGSNATLQLPGAYQLQPYVQRGTLFAFSGPITNDYPVTFSGLNFDGGTYPGYTSDHTFPANTLTGNGWDVTHCAVFDTGSPLNSLKVFTNCTFQHWRGEILKSASAWEGGFNEFDNCTFVDGNASAFNLSFSHNIDGCLLDTLFLGMEFYQGYCVTNCTFQNSIVTNIGGNGLVIVGALTNHNEPQYLIQNNTMAVASGSCIFTSPAANLVVRSNSFLNSDIGLSTSASGYQGTDWNHDWLVTANVFSNVFEVFVNNGLNGDRCENITFSGNLMPACTWAFLGTGSNTNVMFSGNIGEPYTKLDSVNSSGQHVYDDGSNQLAERDDTILTTGTNYISYGWGVYHRASSPNTNGVVWAMDDVAPSKIPPFATLVVRNNGSKGQIIYTSASWPNCNGVYLQGGMSNTFRWTGREWEPATTFHIPSVTVGSIKSQ